MKRLDPGVADIQKSNQGKPEKERHREGGRAAVEMALMLPLLLLLIFGMLEMGWLATTRQTMDAITREATRASVVTHKYNGEHDRREQRSHKQKAKLYDENNHGHRHFLQTFEF